MSYLESLKVYTKICMGHVISFSGALACSRSNLGARTAAFYQQGEG